MHVHGRKSTRGHGEKVPISMSSREALEETSPWAPRFWTRSLRNCEAGHVGCLKPPAFGAWLWQLSWLMHAPSHLIPSTLTWPRAQGRPARRSQTQAPLPAGSPAAGSSPHAYTFPSTSTELLFFHIRNVKLMKETNTFNETYVGHLEGEDLQCVRCETRRLKESVK